jgi:dTDP-L-rhamnose 4-epimerase
MSSKILITGGLGFIGLNVAAFLQEKGYEVVLFDNLSTQIHGMLPTIHHKAVTLPHVQVIRADITNTQALEQALKGVDAIIHLAAETGTAQSMYEIAYYNHVNSQGTALLLQTLQRMTHQVKKLVLSSSRSVYGEGAFICAECSPDKIRYPLARTQAQLALHQWDPLCQDCGALLTSIPTSEEARVHPASIYAATKYAQENLVRIACQSMEIASVILRFQNVYGEGQSLNNPYTGILSIFSTRIRQGKPLLIFEDGRESRDFIHVLDVARAVITALESEVTNGEVMNIGSGVPTSVMAVATMLEQKMGRNLPPEITAQYRVGDIRHCFADIKKAEALIGFKPQISLEEGLGYFTEWVQSQALPEDKLEQANAELRKFKLMN